MAYYRRINKYVKFELSYMWTSSCTHSHGTGALNTCITLLAHARTQCTCLHFGGRHISIWGRFIVGRVWWSWRDTQDLNIDVKFPGNFMSATFPRSRNLTSNFMSATFLGHKICREYFSGKIGSPSIWRRPSSHIVAQWTPSHCYICSWTSNLVCPCNDIRNGIIFM